jgi:hypothetical protein
MQPSRPWHRPTISSAIPSERLGNSYGTYNAEIAGLVNPTIFDIHHRSQPCLPYRSQTVASDRLTVTDREGG